MSWSVVADALQRPRDRSQQACRSRACRPRVRTPATGRRPTSDVRRAACGVRRAACGVRRAACGVRRAACVQCVSAARDRQPVTQPPRHVPALPVGRRTRPASLPRGWRTSAVRFPDCLATRDEHLLAHFHQSLSPSPSPSPTWHPSSSPHGPGCPSTGPRGARSSSPKKPVPCDRIRPPSRRLLLPRRSQSPSPTIGTCICGTGSLCCPAWCPTRPRLSPVRSVLPSVAPD